MSYDWAAYAEYNAASGHEEEALYKLRRGSERTTGTDVGFRVLVDMCMTKVGECVVMIHLLTQ